MKNAKLKQQLLQSPVDAFPQSLKIPEKSPTGYKYYDGRPEMRPNFVYTAHRENDVLTVTVFDTMGNFIYRVFQWADDFCSHFAGEEKPSESTIASAQQGGWVNGRCRRSACGNYHSAGDAAQIINQYISEVDRHGFCYNSRGRALGGIEKLEAYQLSLREKAVKDRNDRIRKVIHDDMLEIRELPKKVIEWINQVPLKSSRYIFYTYKKGAKTMKGTCSHCLREVQVKKPKHRESGMCPNCHSHITYIADGVFLRGQGFVDESRFAYLQPTRAGYCLRMFDLRRKYCTNFAERCYRKQDYIHETERVFYSERHEQINAYKWGDFRQTGTYDWCPQYSKPEYHYINTYIYHGTLGSIAAKDPRMKYAQIPDIAKHCGTLHPTRLMSEPVRYPWVEYLVKLKLYKLVQSVVNTENDWCGAINREGQSLREILRGIGKEDIKRLQAINVTPEALQVYQEIKENDKRIDDRTMQALNWMQSKMDNPLNIRKVINNFDVPLHKAVKYVQNQRAGKRLSDYPSWDRGEHRVLNDIISDWADYLRECTQLGYDLSEQQICYPRNLAEAHTRTSTLIDHKKNKKYDKGVRSRARSLERLYKFEADGLLVRPPESAGEIIAEGKILHHCVGGYAQRHAEGGTTILFIRKTESPDTPYYTMEVSGTVINQCRGLRNCEKTKDVERFLAKWKKAKLDKPEMPVLQSTAKKQPPERVPVGA